MHPFHLRILIPHPSVSLHPHANAQRRGHTRTCWVTLGGFTTCSSFPPHCFPRLEHLRIHDRRPWSSAREQILTLHGAPPSGWAHNRAVDFHLVCLCLWLSTVVAYVSVPAPGRGVLLSLRDDELLLHGRAGRAVSACVYVGRGDRNREA